VSKQRTNALADWIISFVPSQFSEPVPVTIRATVLKASGGHYLLEDADGGLVFAAPAAGVRYVKVKGPEDEVNVAVRKEPAPADPIASALAEKVAGSADPKPPLPKRATGRRTGK